MDGSAEARRRRVLFLQGPPTPFWPELARAFEDAGHETRRLIFCAADLAFWRRRGAHHYRGRFSRWRDHVRGYMRDQGVDAVVYYADRLPYHVVAAEEAEALGIPAYAVEFGYLRPDWLTLERRGMGAFSHFPDTPDAVRAIAAQLPADPAMDERFSHSFLQEASRDIGFNLINALLGLPYPFYQMDKPYHPLLDYPGWIPRLLRSRVEAEEAERVTKRCEARDFRYALVALQMQSDYQIRDNAAYAGLAELIEDVVESFARHAARERRLIFKLHPLDNGLEDWPEVVRSAARRHGVSRRTAVIDGGRLDALIKHADGVVVANSTVGLHAIRAGVPVLALGEAIYSMPGLAHQGPISTFWEAPEPIDEGLAADFVKALAGTIQVKGSFYDPEGRRLAQAEIVRRIVHDRVNAPGAFAPSPPRLPVRRRRMG
ncbi:MAG: capsular biosynthesis protein [Pseudomonadota bacterium]